MSPPILRTLAALLVWLLIAAPSAAPKTATSKTGKSKGPEPYRIEDALTLRSYSDLTWSADGRRLAFVVASVDTAENTNDQDIWLYDHATGRTTQLTRHPKADFSPTFSPSGDTIEYGPAWGDTVVRIGEPLAAGRAELETAGWTVRVLPGLDHMSAMRSDVVLPLVRDWLIRVAPGA